MKPPASVFREYDLRGLVGIELSEPVYRRLGSAFAAYVADRSGKKPSCVLGRDNRPSSAGFSRAFCEGFSESGGSVIDVGIATTPGVYFANRNYKTLAGCAITASHNPPEYNGAKFIFQGESAGGPEVQKIKDHFFAQQRRQAVPGKIEQKDFKDAYFSALVKGSKVNPLRVVVDAGNGAASDFVLPLFQKLGVVTFPIHCDASKAFSVHLPDPVDPENYSDLSGAVRKNKADLGLMFDGDGDRLGAVDSTGNIVWPDQLLILFARDHLLAHPGSKIMVEIKCSQSVFDDVSAHGGKPVLSPTGRTRIEDLMKSENAGLAGEMSGHFFFPPLWLSDAFFAARKLLEIVSQNGPLAAQLSDVPRYFSSQEYRLDVPEKDKFRIVDSLAGHFKKNHGVVTLDGVKVLFSDGWGLVRASNNEPKLSMRFEGKNPKALDRIQSVFREALAGQGVDAPF